MIRVYTVYQSPNCICFQVNFFLREQTLFFKDIFFSLNEKGGLHNHFQQTYPFPIPNIKGVVGLCDGAG